MVCMSPTELFQVLLNFYWNILYLTIMTFEFPALSWDIEAGVFSELHPRRHCLCYQRELTGLPDDQPTEPHLLELRQRLTEQLGNNNNRPFYLKAESGDIPFPDSEEYQTYQKKLVETFTADFIELIRQDVELLGMHNDQKASAKVKTEIQAEIVTHARLGLKRSEHFVGQVKILETIKEVLKDPKNDSPFVIYGPSGSGKTATMMKLVELIKEWFSSDSIVIHRVLGATTQSSGIYNTVISLVQQICLAYNLPLPDPASAFRTLYCTLCTFRDVIEQVAREAAFIRPLFILLDGIDHLQPYEESLRALWAITQLPQNVHVVVSTVPHIGKINLIGALQTLITEATAELEPLTKDETKELVKSISASVNRELTDAQIEKVVSEFKNENKAQPLDLVSFTRQALDWSSTATLEDIKLQSAKQQLSSTLNNLEEQFGQNLVTLLSAYVTCTSVGIHERDLQDLLSMNNDIMEEVHSIYGPSPEEVNQVPVGLIISIKHELEEYLEEHCAYGKPVLAWSHRDCYELVADKYQVIFPGIDEQLITEESTSFTLMLHEYMANMYLPESPSPSENSEETETNQETDQTTVENNILSTQPLHENNILSPQPLIHHNLTKLMRVPVHMKVLLPVEGVERAKKSMVFNFKWLQTKLKAVPAYLVLQDIYSLIILTQHLVEEQVFEEDDNVVKDMEVLYEALQLSYSTLVHAPDALAAQLIGRLGNNKKYTMINNLLDQVHEWMNETPEKVLCPVYPCLTAPEREIRHLFAGPTHVVDFLSNEHVAVMFSQKTGCDVWRVSTGELLHRFPVNPEQSLRGVVPGHVGEFVIIGHYSHLNHKMELGVWSTETGVQLFNSNFPYKFDVFELSSDDQVMIFSTMVEGETSENSQRVIMGINVETKDVLYTIPVTDAHHNGISELVAIEKDVGGVTNGLVSVGDRLSKDLAFWDLSKQCLVFVVSLGCYPSMVKVRHTQGIAVCASPESSTLVIVDLAQGKIQHSIHGSGLKDMNDILLSDFSAQCLVATQASGIVIYDIQTAAQVKSILLPEVDGILSMPTKLLLDPEEQFILAGQSNGNIQILLEETGELIHVLQSHTDAVNSLQFNTKQQLFSASDDGCARVWNGGKILSECHERVVHGDTNAEQAEEVDDNPAKEDVSAILLMPNGKEIVTASHTGVKIWNVDNGKNMQLIFFF